MTAGITWNFYKDDATAVQNARDTGITFHEATPELLAAVKDFASSDLQTVSALFRDTYGVERAEEITAEFKPILEKWYGLVTDIETKEQLQMLYWDQVISKIDPETYAQ